MVRNRVWKSDGGFLNVGGLAMEQRSSHIYSTRNVSSYLKRPDLKRPWLTGYVFRPGPVIEVISSVSNTSTSSIQIRCSNCTEWSSGSLDLESTAADFIWAYSGMPPVDPANSSSDFEIHADYGNFDINLQSARMSTNNTTSAMPRVTATAYLSRRQKVAPGVLYS